MLQSQPVRGSNSRDAEKFAREATLVYRRPSEANCLYGPLLLDRGELRSATRQLERCVEAKPKLVPARERLSEIYLQSGDPEAAIEHLRVLDELKPKDE